MKKDVSMVGFWCDSDIHSAFKVLCARHGVTLKHYLESFIKGELGDGEQLREIHKMIKRDLRDEIKDKR